MNLKCDRYKTLIIAILTILSLFSIPTSVLADEFNCFQAGECDPPALSDSELCVANQDYTIDFVDVDESDVVVLSPHGGKIELNTSKITKNIAGSYGWSRYDFSGHGRESCLDGLNNYERLHITSDNFDEPDALDLVASHPKSVAIHGYSSKREYSRGTICVGGKNKAQRLAFINHIEANRNNFDKYELNGIDATQVKPKDTCGNLGGTKAKNIVNRNSNHKGLQLELNKAMRKDLVKSASSYNKLRNLFYSAISEAMTQ